MCGRFTLTIPDPETLAQAFMLPGMPPDLPPRFNIAPTQPVLAVVRDGDSGDNELKVMRWGLIPSWSKDATIASRLINARSETLAEKPTFRTAFARRRCLIVADGFYEWQKQASGPKVPMYITLADHDVFGFAGLWEHWTEPDSGEAITTCTIITGPPNELIAPIHNRMPVILPREAHDTWLDPDNNDTSALQSLLRPYPADAMTAYPVSRRVNTATHDSPDLIERVE
ncbi:SOS response-associated peptidase [Aggregatilinea lenta]|uniref:SOS response-associated peptidase n=1 Tax=Aggregatilinea lenta TaxID=913108 RepID=UPI000E5A3E51|nr:SOS response-associated peptidase [Aggregatilinea lenta]